MADVERGRETQHVSARNQHHCAFFRGRERNRLRLARIVVFQYAADQKPQTADLFKQPEALVNGVELLDKRVVTRFDAIQHLRRVNQIQHLARDRARQRVAAVSGAVGADAHYGRAALGSEHRANREAAAKRFGGGEHIRRHAVMHISVEVAGAAHAGLHFVENQQRVVAIAQLAQPLQEGFSSRHHAALALHRLDNHRAGIVINQRRGGIEIVKHGMADLRRQRREILGIRRLAASGDGKQRAAVERVFKGHDAAFLRAVVVVGIFAGELQRRLVGFRAGVTEKDAIGEGGVNQAFGEAQHRLVGIPVAGMPDFRRLGFQRLAQFRVRVPERVYRDAAREIDILFAFLIPERGALGPYRNKRGRSINGDHPLIKVLAGN
ncbi:ion transporter, putative [Cronobacter universalis NCTC 9529]|nr:ion transporter, putative [Cronobacter universalis NCTC 9529]